MAAYIEDGHRFLIKYLRRCHLAPHQTSKAKREKWAEDRTPVGCIVVTVREPNLIMLGWSLCRQTASWREYDAKRQEYVGVDAEPDTFTKERARTIAINRAMKGASGNLPRSFQVSGLADEMLARGTKYFADAAGA